MFLVHVFVSVFSGSVFVDNQVSFPVELHVAFCDVTPGFVSVLQRSQDTSTVRIGFAFDSLRSDTHHEIAHGFAASQSVFMDVHVDATFVIFCQHFQALIDGGLFGRFGVDFESFGCCAKPAVDFDDFSPWIVATIPQGASDSLVIIGS